jgi:hypothetical protein
LKFFLLFFFFATFPTPRRAFSLKKSPKITMRLDNGWWILTYIGQQICKTTLLINRRVLLLAESHEYEPRNTACIAQARQHLGLYITGQERQWIMNGKGCERTCQCLGLSYYPRMCLDVIRKFTKTVRSATLRIDFWTRPSRMRWLGGGTREDFFKSLWCQIFVL